MSITVYLNWTYSSYFTLFENVVIRWTQGNLNFLFKGIFSLIYLFDLEVVQKFFNQKHKALCLFSYIEKYQIFNVISDIRPHCIHIKK